MENLKVGVLDMSKITKAEAYEQANKVWKIIEDAVG